MQTVPIPVVVYVRIVFETIPGAKQKAPAAAQVAARLVPWQSVRITAVSDGIRSCQPGFH
jgi:hypothetical protein